jgi:hypothetical protein
VSSAQLIAVCDKLIALCDKLHTQVCSDTLLSASSMSAMLSLHYWVVCRSRSKSPRRHKRSRSRSRERGSSKGRSSSRPNLLQMSYDEYLAHFERIRRQRASGRPDSSQVCTGLRHVSRLHAA